MASAQSATLSAWVAAFNAKDLERICALYAADAVLWGTFSPTLITSSQGLREYFARAFDPSLQASAELQGVEWQLLGPVAVASGSYLLRANMAGSLQLLPARFTFVLVLSGDSWVIANHHSSLTPVQA